MKKSKKALAILLILGVQLFNLGGLYYPFVVHAQTPIGFNVDLKLGTTDSQEVRDLQLFLTQLGYYNGPITGNFFSLTQDGVLAFQRANGISPTGFVGPETRAVLNSPSALPSDITPDFLAWIQKFYPEVNSETRYNRALRERYTLETGRGAGMGDSRNSGVPVYGPLPGETPFVQTLTLPVLLPPGLAESSIGAPVTADFQSWLQQHYSSLSPYNPRVRELYTLLTGRGATVGDSRNTGNPVYGPLPGETPFIQTYTRPSLSSLPIEDIRGTNITDPIVTPPIDVSIFDPRYLDWLDRNSPGANPHDLIIRQRYTNETGLGALKTDARNYNLPRFQQNFPYGNDFIFPGQQPLNFPQPGFTQPVPDGGDAGESPGTPSTPVATPDSTPVGPFGTPPSESEPTTEDNSTTSGISIGNVQTGLSIVGLAHPIAAVITGIASVAYGMSRGMSFTESVISAFQNSLLGIALYALPDPVFNALPDAITNALTDPGIPSEPDQGLPADPEGFFGDPNADPGNPGDPGTGDPSGFSEDGPEGGGGAGVGPGGPGPSGDQGDTSGSEGEGPGGDADAGGGAGTGGTGAGEN